MSLTNTVSHVNISNCTLMYTICQTLTRIAGESNTDCITFGFSRLPGSAGILLVLTMQKESVMMNKTILAQKIAGRKKTPNMKTPWGRSPEVL